MASRVRTPKSNVASSSLLEELKKTSYAGQQRTGHGKVFSFYRGDLFYKGPYSKSKAENVITRSEILKQWKTPYIVHPIKVEQESGNGNYWIIYENLSKDYPIEEYIDHKESFSDHEYKIATRTKVDKLSNQILTNPWVYEDDKLIEAYVHLFIIGAGDVNLSNTLIDTQKKKLYLIDYEENRTRDRDDSTFYFVKPPGKKYNWYENFGYLYDKVADRIEENLKVFGKCRSRAETAIALLRKFALKGEKKAMSKTLRTASKTASKVGSPSTKDKGKSPARDVGSSSGSQDLGQMKKGAFSGTTYSGFSVSVMKSALQKYIRRGNKKALFAAFELYRMQELGQLGKGVLTNFINRLKVIAAEDVGIASFNLALSIIDILNRNPKPSPSMVNAIVRKMLPAKKTRLASHVNTAYCKPHGVRYVREKHDLNIDNKEDIDLAFTEKHRQDKVFDKIKDPKLVEYSLMFYKNLKEQDFNAIRWACIFNAYVVQKQLKIPLRVSYIGEQNKPKKIGGSKPVVLLWDLMDKIYDKEPLNILRWAYFEKSKGEIKATPENPNPPRCDSRVFFLLASLAIIFQVKYKPLDFKEDESDLDTLLKSKYKLELDDYVMDIHTKEGKVKGKEYFLTETSKVIPEDMHYRYDEFYDAYLNSEKEYKRAVAAGKR
jgi:hypothetical protein